MDTALRRIDRISRDHPHLAFKLAIHFADQAEQSGRSDLLLDSCYVRYLIHERRGETNLIANEVEAGIQQAHQLGLTAQGARLLQARGRIAQIEGRYQQAIEAWMQALELAHVCEDYATAVEARIGLAQANTELKNPDEGYRYLLAAKPDVEHSGDDYLAAKYAINLGVSAIQYEQWDRALSYFQTGLHYSIQGHIREYIAESYWHLGHTEMELGQLPIAEQHLAQAIELAQKFHYLWLESVCLDSQAELYQRQNNPRAEIECLCQAYRLAEQTGSLARQLDYAIDLVDANEREGQFAAALHWMHIERRLNTEHFRRSLEPVHRNMKALDISEQDAHEQLLTLSLQDDVGLAPLLAKAKPLLNVDWLGLWFSNPYLDSGELAAEAPPSQNTARLITRSEFPASHRLLNQLLSPLPLSRATLHEAASEFARLLGHPISSLMFVPIRQANRIGLLLLSNGQGEGHHNWSRDDVFRASLLQQLIERWLANEERQQLQQEIERGERVSALGSLVAAVAHDLNTPTGICITTASILENNVAELNAQFESGKMAKSTLASFIEQQSSACDTINRNLQRIVSLIERFRDIPKQQYSDHWQMVNLAQLISGLSHEQAHLFAKQTIQIQLQGDDRLHTAVPIMTLAQIITQLFENAAKHAFIGRPTGTITLAWARKAQQIQLSYQDNGLGMPADLVRKIFDPFFTSKFGQGTNGLGMTRVYQLITQQMHGTVRVESEMGQGLSINLSWPEPDKTEIKPENS